MCSALDQLRVGCSRPRINKSRRGRGFDTCIMYMVLWWKFIRRTWFLWTQVSFFLLWVGCETSVDGCVQTLVPGCSCAMTYLCIGGRWRRCNSVERGLPPTWSCNYSPNDDRVESCSNDGSLHLAFLLFRERCGSCVDGCVKPWFQELAEVGLMGVAMTYIHSMHMVERPTTYIVM
jgi:hypothetical protein